MERELVQLLRDQQKDLKQGQQELKQDLKESLSDHYTALSGKIKAEVDKVDVKVDQILLHNSAQDERIVDLEDTAVECKAHRKGVGMILGKWKIILLLAVIGLYGLHNAFDNITIKDIIAFIKLII